jgi:hypothetical protein
VAGVELDQIVQWARFSGNAVDDLRLLCGHHDRLAANDGSADATPGGGIGPRKEVRVTMRTERLFISHDKVRVEHEFVKDSKEDVWSGVAFPLPEYSFSPVCGWPDIFTDFKPWVGALQVIRWSSLPRAVFAALLGGAFLVSRIQPFSAPPSPEAPLSA